MYHNQMAITRWLQPMGAPAGAPAGAPMCAPMGVPMCAPHDPQTTPQQDEKKRVHATTAHIPLFKMPKKHSLAIIEHIEPLLDCTIVGPFVTSAMAGLFPENINARLARLAQESTNPTVTEPIPHYRKSYANNREKEDDEVDDELFEGVDPNLLT